MPLTSYPWHQHGVFLQAARMDGLFLILSSGPFERASLVPWVPLI
jgi:hypothetical protein